MVDSDVSSTEDEEAENTNQKVWRVILHWNDNNDCCSDVLDHGGTIEKIMDSANHRAHCQIFKSGIRFNFPINVIG